jgi:hypothetical protein
MKEKKSLLVPGVTTYEALLSGIAQNCCVMGIEEPLYTQLRAGSDMPEQLRDYDLEDHPNGRFFLARKARGENRFIEEHYTLRYLLLDMDATSCRGGS